MTLDTQMSLALLQLLLALRANDPEGFNAWLHCHPERNS